MQGDTNWGLVLYAGEKGSKAHLGQQSESSDRPDLAVKMDYSNTYRENDDLDDVLEEQLDEIHKDQYRMWSEKSAQLKQIRKQVEVIVRLRQAVNTRKPGDSIDIVTSARPRRQSSQYSMKMEEKPVESIDVDEIAKATRMQMRIAQERDKFSSKNLFNVPRKNNGFGFIYTGSNATQSNSNSNNRLFAPRKSQSMGSVQMNSSSNGGADDFVDSAKIAKSKRQRPETAYVPAGYRRDTLQSARGNRPRTAMELRRSIAGGNTDDPLPVRPPSARRSRSRRELELLCRMYSDIDESSIAGDDVPPWEIVRENQRKQKLQNLRNQREHLDLRVQRFLTELEKFNNPKSGNKSQSCLALYDAEKVL